METTPIKIEELQTSELTEDRTFLVIMHLSMLLSLPTIVGGLIVPYILWVTKKKEIKNVDQQGKQMLNFKLSMYVYLIISTILLLIAVGLIGFIIVGMLMLVFPIVNAINVSNGKDAYYPLTIEFIK